MNPKRVSGFLLVLAVVMAASSADANTIQVFTDRSSWENALAGRRIQTESFDDFSGFTYQAAGAPAFQFPAGMSDVGLLQFDIDRPSGNLIVGGTFPDMVNGTTFWRIETATRNGSTPPVTPALDFSQGVFGFGADFNFIFTPRSTMAFGDTSLRFADYLTSGVHFLGVVTSLEFTRVEFDVERPVNNLFHADNVSFATVPEPSSLILGVLSILLLATRVRRFDRSIVSER